MVGLVRPRTDFEEIYVLLCLIVTEEVFGLCEFQNTFIKSKTITK